MRDADLNARARAMRRAATPPERAVWRALRMHPFDALHFRRQVAFDDRCVADFASHRARVVVEVDGRSHDLTAEADALRTTWLQQLGYRVVRVSNAQAMGDRYELAMVLAHLLGIECG